MPAGRRSLLWASHATYSDALVAELLIPESFRSRRPSVIKVASRSTAVAAMIASGSFSRYCARKLTILSISPRSARPRPTTSTPSENSWKILRSFSLRLGKAKNSIWERMEIPTHSADCSRYAKAFSPRSKHTMALVSNR